jgi:uncharacterized DUF497 family protein
MSAQHRRETDPVCSMYTKCLHDAMFEWDEAKRLAVLADRGIDFEDAWRVFDGRPVHHVPSPRNNEDRVASIAGIDGKFYTVVWVWRGDNQRIISFRRARHGEERAYRQVYG